MGDNGLVRRGGVLRVVVVVLCLAAVALGLRMLFPARVAHPDYQAALMALSREVVPESEASRRNAEILRDAAELMAKIHRESISEFSWEEQKKLPGRSDPIYRLLDVSEDEVASMEEPQRLQHRYLERQRALYVERIAPMFEGLGVQDRVAPMLVPPEDPRASLVDVVMLGGNELRSLAEWEAVLAYEAIGSGDTDRAAAHLRRLGWLARATNGAPFLVARLMGNSVEGLALGGVMAQLAAGRIDGGSARAYLEMLEEIEGTDPGLLPVIEGDRLGILSIVERVFAGDERLRGAFKEGSLPSWWFRRVFPVERRVFERVEAYFDRMRDPVLQRDVAAVREIGAEFDRRESGMDAFAYQVVPSLSVWMDQQVLLEHLREAVATMLAIEVYAAERGRLPDRLEALVPQYVRALPRDLLSGDGSFLRYRVLGEGEEAPVERGYVLWSVGPNGRDDGGVMRVESLLAARQWDDEEGVVQLLSAAQRGTRWDGDIVLNMPRERLWAMMRDAGWTTPTRSEKPVLIDLGGGSR